MKRIFLAAAMAVVMAPGAMTSAQQTQTSAPTPEKYKIGTNDVLVVTVWRRADLSGEVVVSKEGKVKLWGTEIEVLGLGTDDLRKNLAAELSKVAAGAPQVFVQVKQIATRK